MIVLSTDQPPANPKHSDWLYNGLDCLVTKEVFDVLEPQVKEEPLILKTYTDTLNKIGPSMEMSLRGISINRPALVRIIGEVEGEIGELTASFDFLCEGVFERTINVGSPKQKAALLYDWLHVPKFRGSRSADKAHLERAKRHFDAVPFVNFILEIMDRREQLKQLCSELDSRGRRTFNLNPAGTSTGRWSCRKSCFWIGYNTQNVDERLKVPFEADKGRTLVNVDLEQADSRNVGAVCYSLFGRSPYLDACESGDLHTAVCQLVWPDVDFGDDPRSVADEPFYRAYSRRDCAKRIGHGTNYGGSPYAIHAATQVPQSLIKDFQARYFEAFPDIYYWVRWTRLKLKLHGHITTLFGRKRYFLGRTWTDDLLKDALAYQGQSMTAHENDAGLMSIWRNLPDAQLLIPVHDSVLSQVPQPQANAMTKTIMALMTWESVVTPKADSILLKMLQLADPLKDEWLIGCAEAIAEAKPRPFTVPVEAATGWNWQDPTKVNEFRDDPYGHNPHGLKKWKGAELREPPNRLC